MFKILRFKNLDIPLPSSSLLLTGVVGLLLVGSLVGGSVIKNRMDNRARAQRLIGRPFVTTLTSQRATLTFTTSKSVISKLEINAPFISQSRTLPISNVGKTLHQITLKDLRPNTQYQYRIIIYSEEKLETKSEWFKFSTP
jgi:hypothetical protein